LDELYIVEQKKDVPYDVPASLSGDIMYEVAQHAQNIDDHAKLALCDMMKNIGIWIYLADAVEDIEDDAKKGCFNPFLKEGVPNYHKLNEAKDIMTFALSRAQLAYNLLKLEKSAPIMDNIIRYSLPAKQSMIFSNKETV
jgi:hypothetical protein